MNNQIDKPNLFEPLLLRSLRAKNRIVLSPMCQYSATNGIPDDWHLAALGQRAVGGGGIIFTEATAVEPRGLISKHCLGIYNDKQQAGFEPIVNFINKQDGLPAIQLAHAGRKASTTPPWEGTHPLKNDFGGWKTRGPSQISFGELPLPEMLSIGEIEELAINFGASARRAREVGFQILEIHAAHGYLLHEFFSPLSNHRKDNYGGSFENRTRILHDVVSAVRSEWPSSLPLFVRLSCTDWVEGGWNLDQTISLVNDLVKAKEVDVIDCSSGGIDPSQKIALGAGYQVPFANAVRQETGILTAAVGLITESHQANEIVESRQADLVMFGRAYLADPYLPLRFAAELGFDIKWPNQIARGRSAKVKK